ncbi:MAG: transglutaminase-like domain-containing protein [Acidobacteriota bacterium]
MPVRLSSLVTELESALAAGSHGLARAALLLCRVESPEFVIEPALVTLTDLGHRARALVAGTEGPVRARLAAINHLLFEVEGFRGDRERYDDVRNSLLAVVLERKRGIPITLAVVYMTVAQAAGVDVMGVAFPGHFLMRVPRDAGDDSGPLMLDPFDEGRELDRVALERLLAQHAGDEVPLEPGLLLPCSTRHIVVRMLNNMKRLYVGARSFAQAWHVTDLLIALDGRQSEDMRDRGLIAYHLDDFAPALLDLETYLAMDRDDDGDHDERQQIREHVAALRRRVAGMN